MPTTDEFLAHHGVKGMKWGKRKAEDSSSDGSSAPAKQTRGEKKKVKLDAKITKSNASVQERAKTVASLESHLSDLNNKGPKAEIFKVQFKQWADASDEDFRSKFGYSKPQGAANMAEQIRDMRNNEAMALNMSASRNARLKKKADKLSHDDLDPEDEDELGDIDELDTPAFLRHYDIEPDGLEDDYLMHADEEFDTSNTLAHFGVKGMKWGHRKAEGSESTPSARKVKREEYKANLKSANKKKSMWTGGVKRGQSYTPAEAAALRKSARRQIAGSLALYGGIQVASFALGKGLENSAAKRASAAATAGQQFNNRNLKAIGDLSTFTLRKGAGGSWG